MTVRIGKIYFQGWRSIAVPGGYTDTFQLRLRADAGLPPRAYAQAVRRMVKPVFSLRRSMSLWVQLEGAPGYWYRRALRNALRGLPCPIAVLNGVRIPDDRDFSFRPWTDRVKSQSPPVGEPLYDPGILSTRQGRCLQVLARLQAAYTAEIASLLGSKNEPVRLAMGALLEAGYVEYIRPEGSGARKKKLDESRAGQSKRPDWSNPAEAYNLGEYNYWAIRRPGVSRALRSWGIPPGVSFPERQERVYVRNWHRRVARMWPAWVRLAWPQIEVWATWTEVKLGRLRPDVLVWGRLGEREILLMMEIERGNQMKTELRMRVGHRFQRALWYVRGFRLPLVFVVLSRPGARQTLLDEFAAVPADAAVVLADWRRPEVHQRPGRRQRFLPAPEWGRTRFVPG